MYDNPNKAVKYNVQHILPAMIIVSLGNRACVDTRGEDIWEEERVGRGGRKGKRGEREEEVREGRRRKEGRKGRERREGERKEGRMNREVEGEGNRGR